MPTRAEAATTGGDGHRRALDFTPINGWRGPGAIAIALAHFGVATGFLPLRMLEPVAPLVDLFFVLSGLVIAHAYGAALARPAAIPGYIVRRFGRIWPVQAVTLAVLVGYELAKLLAVRVTGHQFSSAPFDRHGINLIEAVPTNLLLVQSLGLHDRETWNFPSWSLSVELVTYVGFAAFCLIRPPLRRVLSVATIAVSLAILATQAPNGMRSTFDYGLFRCSAGFFAGSLCYDCATRWPLPRTRISTALEIATVAVTIVWLALSVHTAAAYAAPLVFSLFVFVFLGTGGWLSRALSSRPLQVLAEGSFCIYMVHALVLTAMLAVLHVAARHFGLDLFRNAPVPAWLHSGTAPTLEVLHLRSNALKWAMAAAYLVGVLLASRATYKLVEVPGRRVFSRAAQRLSARPVKAPRQEIDAMERVT